MDIIRNIRGKNEIITLTDEEKQEAYREVCFMNDEQDCMRYLEDISSSKDFKKAQKHEDFKEFIASMVALERDNVNEGQGSYDASAAAFDELREDYPEITRILDSDADDDGYGSGYGDDSYDDDDGYY